MNWDVWSSAESALFTLDEYCEAIMATGLRGLHIGQNVAVWVGKSFVYGQISRLKFKLAPNHIKVTLGEGKSAVRICLGLNDPVRMLNLYEARVHIAQVPTANAAVTS